MFTKIFKLAFGLLMMLLIISNISEAQTKKTVYPVFSIAPVGGVQFPISSLNDLYGPSWSGGLDLGLAVNRETSFYLNATYFNMPRKNDVAVGPDASYIGITAGPRYVFTSPKIKAKFFIEAGLGVYIFNMKEYTIVTSGEPDLIIPSASKTNFGANVGPGVIIPLGQAADLLMKTKLHYTFGNGETGGSKTFVAAVIGVDFKL